MKKSLQILFIFVLAANNYRSACATVSPKNSAPSVQKKIVPQASSIAYYIHPVYGNDASSGTSPGNAFKTLQQIEKIQLHPGDSILLAANQVYTGSLRLLNQQGETGNPIEITTRNWNKEAVAAPATINFKGRANGILIQDCSSVHVSNIKLTADGFDIPQENSEMRCGVLIKNTSQPDMKDIELNHLDIKNVYYENAGFIRDKNEVQTANGTQKYGWGIRLISSQPGNQLHQVAITNCHVSDVCHTGIKLTGNNKNIKDVRIVGNTIMYTGGPGIQMSEVQAVYVADNLVDHSGSNNDSRKWGRGSGLWTWGSSDVLIEKNKFLYANGPGDSDGAHIDYNCDNIIIQYNLSAYNAGGFCEILGNNFNCIYRYNISVNDGNRIKGKEGAFQEGKTLWLSGYQGNNKKRKGPVNTYIYNNTIYTDHSIEPKIAFDNTSKDILIANNIFYLSKPFKVVQGDQNNPDVKAGKDIENMQLMNNLFLTPESWPAEMQVKSAISFLGDPKFAKPGGLNLKDYMPLQNDLVRNKGVNLADWKLNKETRAGWLLVEKDILGNPISSKPGIGAIESVFTGGKSF